MRNASGLTAADLAHAQGFRECAEILSNAQNLQRNLAQSQIQPNGFCFNGTAQNGDHSQSIMQGRNFLNGMGNRKRSFDSMDAHQIKKPRTDGILNGNRPHGGAEDAQMESMNAEAASTLCSAADPVCGNYPSNGHVQAQLLPEADVRHCHHSVTRGVSENMFSSGTEGSQVEHQKSVTAEQFYDHALYSTMLLYHGS